MRVSGPSPFYATICSAPHTSLVAFCKSNAYEINLEFSTRNWNGYETADNSGILASTLSKPPDLLVTGLVDWRFGDHFTQSNGDSTTWISRWVFMDSLRSLWECYLTWISSTFITFNRLFNECSSPISKMMWKHIAIVLSSTHWLIPRKERYSIGSA